MWLNIFILYFVDKKRFKMLTVWHIQTQEKNSVKFEQENPTLWFRLQHQMCQISSHTFLSSTDPLRSSQLKFLLNSVSTTSRTLHNWQYSLSLSLSQLYDYFGFLGFKEEEEKLVSHPTDILQRKCQIE